uniref:Uncharacterized protein n=1 Tax=Ditylenchus dipsaci TaxID=166011 RepID=A0A915CRU3_9BILA
MISSCSLSTSSYAGNPSIASMLPLNPSNAPRAADSSEASLESSRPPPDAPRHSSNVRPGCSLTIFVDSRFYQ